MYKDFYKKMVCKLSVKDKRMKLKGLEGWYKRTATLLYGSPGNDNLKTFDLYLYVNQKHIDSEGEFGLYQALTFKSQVVADDLVSSGATTAAVNLKLVVATIDDKGNMKLEFPSVDDKNIWLVNGNGKTFNGTITEFGVKTNDNALGGAVAGYASLRKLKNAPRYLKNMDIDINFNKEYKKQYDTYYKK
jgi:hypothetical protein